MKQNLRDPKDVIINGKSLAEIIEDHKQWINNLCGEKKANLSNIDLSNVDLCATDLNGANLYNSELSDTDLSYANLIGANLSFANLSGADLKRADLSDTDLRCTNLFDSDLSYANLYNADLSYADLNGANLSFANLSDADLKRADLSDTDLSNANLKYANLKYANLSNADLSYANFNGTNLNYANFNGAKGNLIEYRKGKILTESIIGYKKCKYDVIVKLEIPKDAIVFSINGNKCRTNKAKVLEIEGCTRGFAFYNNMSYYIGDEFNVKNFDCIYNNECGEGIHFFMTREEAIKYNY